MKNIFRKLPGCFCLFVVLFAAGCTAVSPEYFEELSGEERAALLRSAKIMALQSKTAVPAHLRTVFAELAPYERIVYDGNKHGKASFRWEIYENPANSERLTQKDINPYWIMVYAMGDLLDPRWKLSHANEDLQPVAAAGQQPGNQPNRSRKVRQVRYKR